MGNITLKMMRHYVGLDADKASIPAAGREKGDSYHANDKGKQYYWDGANWKTGLGYEYVVRDATAVDKQVGDFVTDGTWKVNGLDLSGIVPAEAVAVNLRVIVGDDAAASVFNLRRNATQDENFISMITQVANINIEFNSIIAIDADRLLDYFGSNLAFAAIEMTVVGWFI